MKNDVQNINDFSFSYLSYGKSKLDEPRESQRKSNQFRSSGKGETEDELEPLKKPEKYLDVNQIV